MSATAVVSDPATIAKIPSSTRWLVGGGERLGRSSLFYSFCARQVSTITPEALVCTYQVVEKVLSGGFTLNPVHSELSAARLEHSKGTSGAWNTTHVGSQPWNTGKEHGKAYYDVNGVTSSITMDTYTSPFSRIDQKLSFSPSRRSSEPPPNLLIFLSY